MQNEWKTAWRYLPINFDTTIGVMENVTQRVFYMNNITGSKVRIRFSNLYSDEALILDKVTIGKVDKNSPDVIKSFAKITLLGREVIELAPKEECDSDELYFPITSQEDIVLSVYIKEKTKIKSVCETWSARTWKSVFGKHGDYTLEQKFEESNSQEVFEILSFDEHNANVAAAITSIQILTNQEVKTIALFGDSITHMSYYSDAFTEQLYQKFPGKLSVVNAGIGGNRLLSDYSYVEEIPGNGTIFGRPGIDRFEQDVYCDGEKEYVIILIGINDFTHPYALNHPNEIITIEAYIDGLRQLIQTAHSHNSEVILGTLTPFRGENMEWFEKVEELRQKANTWIREQRTADGIADFDKAVQQPENPAYMLDDCHLGDGLHPNERGGRLMANAFSTEWF